MPPFPLNSLSRRLLRQAVLRVHPDVFAGGNPEAASFNAESLVKLNAFVESLAQGKRPRATRLDFWIYQQDTGENGGDGAAEATDRKDRTSTRRVSATLPRSGSLLPLFVALGLATAGEPPLAGAGAEEGGGGGEGGDVSLGPEEADLLEWLASAARSAAAAGGERAALAAALRAAAADAAQRHGLGRPVALADCVSSSASKASLRRALEAVRALDEAIALFGDEQHRRLSGEEEAGAQEDGGRLQSGEGGGDTGGEGGSVGGESGGKPLRGLHVRLHTPSGPRRRFGRGEKKEARRRAAEGEGARGATEEEEEGADDDADDGDADDGSEPAAARAWVSPRDGSLCVLLPPRCPSPPSPALFLRALRRDAAPDLPTARALSAAAAYWRRRAAELSCPAAEALGVERVSWAEEDEEGESEGDSPLSAAAGSRGEPPPPSPARQFVAWAAAVLGEAGDPRPPLSEEEEVEQQRPGEEESFLPPPLPLRRRRLSLSVVVHPEGPESISSLSPFVAGGGGGEGEGGEGFFSPEASSSNAAAAAQNASGAPPPFHVSAGTLHVSSASAPGQLLAFLRSEVGAMAALTAEREAEEGARAEREMEAAARALGAAAVVRVSPSASLEEIVAAARRLAGSAPLLDAAGIDLAGVTLAIDDVFEAWHDDDDDEYDSDTDSISNGKEGGEERRRRRRRYCGILSVPFDFEAPDLGAAVARMMRSSLPSTLAREQEDGRGGPSPGAGPSGEGREGVLDVSASAAAARGLPGRRTPPSAPGPPPPLPPRFLRGRGRGRGGARRRSPPLSRATVAVAPRASPSPSGSSSAPSPLFRRLRVL